MSCDMGGELFDRLAMDHECIRSQLSELKTTCDNPKRNEDQCLSLFRILKALVVAHNKAEEFVLYATVEQPRSHSEAELQHHAFEGYEEHDLIDFLMKEMGQAEEISLQWRAQLTVLGEMLDRHLSGEEQDFFPKIHKLFSEQELADLADVYTKERDMIFAKKSGIRPALSMASSAHPAN